MLVIQSVIRFGVIFYIVLHEGVTVHTCMSLQGARSFVLNQGGSI
jgi:hypothetical protein